MHQILAVTDKSHTSTDKSTCTIKAVLKGKIFGKMLDNMGARAKTKIKESNPEIAKANMPSISHFKLILFFSRDRSIILPISFIL
jgi:hypothetical protein